MPLQKSLIFIAFIATSWGSIASRADDIAVLRAADIATKADRLLYEHLQRQARQRFAERQARYDALKTPEDCHAYQQRLREFFVQQLGGFPEQTPLNGEVVGRIPGEGYTIEKVVFESQPNHHVTANLYLPKSESPVPCVLVSSGHSRTAKAADYNQKFAIIMAKNGIAAMCYDPIGQGERSMILDDQGQPKNGGTTLEHLQIGVGSILVGTNTACYRVWDAMRAIDYAQSRKEIDADRIGFMGCSGGGTVTSYVMALDDRVKCAAPSCYLTTMQHLIDSIGPQDAEQNIFGQIAFGLDHPDLVMMRAPRPTIISATNEDFFSIQGTWENFRQAKRFYGRLGHSERLDIVEGDGPHGVPIGNLNAIMRWMRRWLLNKDDAPNTNDFLIREVAELQCIAQGQVLRLPNEMSVADLNAKRLRELDKSREEFWRDLTPSAARKKICEVAAIGDIDQLPLLDADTRGTIEGEHFTIERILLKSAEGIPLPSLLCRPKQGNGRLCLYVPGKGKSAEIKINEATPGKIEVSDNVRIRVEKGDTILITDLPGIGETRPNNADKMLGIWREYFVAYLLGKSLVGIRAEATIQAATWLRKQEADKPIHLIGSGETAVATLHAAALTDLFDTVVLDTAPRSWHSLVGLPETENQLVNTVHGVLNWYDTPDLIRMHGNVRWPEN
jgi:dienelactone hydrolase